jgi:hypothetical protein
MRFTPNLIKDYLLPGSGPCDNTRGAMQSGLGIAQCVRVACVHAVKVVDRGREKVVLYSPWLTLRFSRDMAESKFEACTGPSASIQFVTRLDCRADRHHMLVRFALVLPDSADWVHRAPE